MKHNFLFVSILLIVSVALSKTQNQTEINFISKNGSVDFTAVGKPGMIKILGHSEGPAGEVIVRDHKMSGRLKLDLNKLSTGIDLRDEHMKNKYLEVQKFPEAELTWVDINMEPADLLQNKKENTIHFPAKLTLHGKIQDVSVEVKATVVTNELSIDAEMSIPVMNFLDTLPSYAGIKIADEVQVKINTKGQIK